MKNRKWVLAKSLTRTPNFQPRSGIDPTTHTVTMTITVHAMNPMMMFMVVRTRTGNATDSPIMIPITADSESTWNKGTIAVNTP